MGLFTSMNIASTGLTAQRLRMDVISDNIANANSTGRADGHFVQRKSVILRPRDESFVYKLGMVPQALDSSPGQGVRVVRIEEQKGHPRYVYNPDHPDALKGGKYKGYVAMPDINIVTEMVDLISASRSYEANVTVVNSAKGMFTQALTIGRA